MATNCSEYDFLKIEPHWQKNWEENKTFKAVYDTSKPKYYILDMFPYPSGAGLHIGHPEGYTASDILGRYKKANGFNVLHPMGWDAFGLPAEQYAIQTGTHPAKTTASNVDNFRRQIKSLGFAIDWDREINTTDPEYFRWTQWIFLQLFKKGLAYVGEKPVWWCPELKAVLANEEIVDGLSERGKHPVERKNLRQVVLRITEYAEKLLKDLDGIDWPNSTKRQQIAWIGRSEGAEVKFKIENSDDSLTVYTTRPDTLFGATYMVIAPEHAAINQLVTDKNKQAVADYAEKAKAKSDLDRTDLAKGKSGVFTGSYCINPINGDKVPVWVADYVLISYGTGAIMAVPAHDERDFEFAETYDIPIIQVIEPSKKKAGEETRLPFSGVGTMINSGEYTGKQSDVCKKEITEKLEKEKVGKSAVNYKLRDWIFSRQRYWGEPIPLVWVSKENYDRAASKDSAISSMLPDDAVSSTYAGELLYALPLPDSELPLKLPETDNYHPSENGESPLANQKDWLNIWFNIETGVSVSSSESQPEGENWVKAIRETNTMPQWAGSCWYYLRYLDPKNDKALVDPEIEKYWGSPDFYIGGSEHAVLHLLYARFWHKVLYEIGAVSNKEPFSRLFHQGLILGEDGNKMSKSLGNTVSPDEITSKYGADSLRLFEMFLGPLEATKPWNQSGIEGVHRFLKKIWRILIDADGKIHSKVRSEGDESKATLRLLHESIQKVSDDIEDLRFNTAISQLMILSNHLQKVDNLSLTTAKTVIQLLAPLAPHMCEELWERFGGKESVINAPWPKHDASLLQQEEIKVIFQVNGKVRSEGFFPKATDKEAILEAAKNDVKVQKFLEGKTIRKEIYVPGKIVNIAVS